MPLIKYRSFNPDLLPRRTRLEVPGWAGTQEPRQNGSHEQPWHCIPFTEAARAGLELPYPHPDELRVSTRDGEILFEGEFGEAGDPDARRPPFRSFGRSTIRISCCLTSRSSLGGVYALRRTRDFSPIRRGRCQSRCRRFCGTGGR